MVMAPEFLQRRQEQPICGIPGVEGPVDTFSRVQKAYRRRTPQL
jgi:hypothetical protein